MPIEIKPIKFPEDESAHDHIIEWWYFNGRLKDKEGNEYSFMNCLFKVDVKKVKIPFFSKIPLKVSYFSHSLLTDLKNQKFYHRINPFSIISEDSFTKPSLFINYINPEIRSGYTNCAIEKIGAKEYRVKNEEIDLIMTSMKKPLFEGGRGFLDLGAKSTYYYSLTSLKTEGRIKIGNKWIDVRGKSWMDHQWANTEYSPDRWDWFSVQLQNDTEIVCGFFDDGRKKTRFAGISHPGGRQEHFKDVEMTPLEDKWTSPKSKAGYPLAWKIKIPEKNIEMNIKAMIRDQEMLFGSINYWEGPLDVECSFDGKKVKGNGFMELVGYPSQYTNIRYLTDEIGRTASRFANIAKNKAFDIAGIKRKRTASV